MNNRVILESGDEVDLTGEAIPWTQSQVFCITNRWREAALKLVVGEVGASFPQIFRALVQKIRKYPETRYHEYTISDILRDVAEALQTRWYHVFPLDTIQGWVTSFDGRDVFYYEQPWCQRVEDVADIEAYVPYISLGDNTIAHVTFVHNSATVTTRPVVFDWDKLIAAFLANAVSMGYKEALEAIHKNPK